MHIRAQQGGFRTSRLMGISMHISSQQWGWKKTVWAMSFQVKNSAEAAAFQGNNSGEHMQKMQNGGKKVVGFFCTLQNASFCIKNASMAKTTTPLWHPTHFFFENAVIMPTHIGL